jgi:anthranilate synthase/aminodeoxychorismate synthase-like glutamine amidotransferase
MILLIDNYDSFTYNLVQRIGEISNIHVEVYRNDKLNPQDVEALNPERIIISPGPCTPREAGVSNDILLKFASRIPILGVCLGHQCIGHSFGAVVERNWRLMHGKTSEVFHDNQGVFAGLSNPFTAARYHSLVIRPGTLSNDFVVTAWTKEDEIMGVRHRKWPLHGVQFHPESFLTTEGHQLLRNFLAVEAPAMAV